jgi:flagellar protein FliO/FliZ
MTEATDIPWLNVIFSFCVVLALMGVLAAALKYFAERGFVLSPKGKRARRMKIVESLPLDPKRRCVIVRCDDREHLLLLGGQGDIVVESNLPPAKTQNTP